MEIKKNVWKINKNVEYFGSIRNLGISFFIRENVCILLWNQPKCLRVIKACLTTNHLNLIINKFDYVCSYCNCLCFHITSVQNHILETYSLLNVIMSLTCNVKWSNNCFHQSSQNSRKSTIRRLQSQIIITDSHIRLWSEIGYWQF